MADLQSINFSTPVIYDIKYWLEHRVFPQEIVTAEQRRHYTETFKSFHEHDDKLYHENRVVIRTAFAPPFIASKAACTFGAIP